MLLFSLVVSVSIQPYCYSVLASRAAATASVLLGKWLTSGQFAPDDLILSDICPRLDSDRLVATAHHTFLRYVVR